MSIVAELQEYLGNNYEPHKLVWTMPHAQKLTAGRTFEQLAQAKEIHYVLAQLERDAWWQPHLVFFKETMVTLGLAATQSDPPATVLEVGDSGAFGLALGNGYDVAYADTHARVLEFVRWRLRKHGDKAKVYDLGKDHPPLLDAVLSFWTVQRLEPSKQWLYVQHLAALGRVVVLDLDTAWAACDSFHPVDFSDLLERIHKEFNVIRYKNVNHHVHLIAFQTGVDVEAPDDGDTNDEEHAPSMLRAQRGSGAKEQQR